MKCKRNGKAVCGFPEVGVHAGDAGAGWRKTASTVQAGTAGRILRKSLGGSQPRLRQRRERLALRA